MIINSQRTLYGLQLQMHMLLHKDYTPLTNTTLNEKFDILKSEEIAEGEYPKLDYIAIGIGGTEIIDNSDYKFSKHKAIDAALFEHVPFVMRELDNDLLPSDRVKYRFRKIEIFDNTEYACYYLKKFERVIMQDGLYVIDTQDNQSILKFMDTDRSDLLNPVPRLVKDYLDISKNSYTANTAKIEFSLYIDELAALDTVMNIRYGESKNLTEIALCSGIDTEIDGGDNMEAANVIVNYFVGIDINTYCV